MNAAYKQPDGLQAAFENDDEEISLGDLLGVLIENRLLIAAFVLVALIIGSYNAFTAVPVYRADGLLQVEEKSGGFANLDVASMLEDYVPVNAEMEILRSRSVLGDVVDNLKLDIRAYPEFGSEFSAALARRKPVSQRPEIKVDTLDVSDELRGTWFKLVKTGSNGFDVLDQNDNPLGNGIVGEPSGFSFSDEPVRLFVSVLQGEPEQVYWVGRMPRISSIQSLQGALSVSERAEWSGILEISVRGTDPLMVQQQVNEVANVYVRRNVERKSAEAQKTLEFLDKQLPIIRQELEIAEFALNSHRIEKGSVDLPLETQTILQTIVSVEAQLNQLRQEREKLLQSFTAVHPMVATLDRQIDGLNVELNDLNNQVRDLPTTQQELLRLIRDVEVTTALYRSLLDTSQELRVVKAGTVGNVRVIDYAVKPSSPVAPNRTRILLIALLLGGFLGVATAFARKALKSGVDDPDIIERHIGIPVYATIAHSNRQDRIFNKMKSNEADQAILADDSPGDASIESLRNLRTALHFGMMDVESNSIMITGPSPEVGKSFVSVNLAAVLAASDKKVLLIDADLRRGHLHKYLGVERENGLTEFVSGEIPLSEALHETSIDGLTIIPTGTLPPNPAELLLHKRFTDSLDELGKRYDHVIIDSPPILAATDAAIIGHSVGGTLLVLKAGEHSMREIEQSVKRLQQADVNLRGILFNDVKSSGLRYGAGKYHYQYKY